METVQKYTRKDLQQLLQTAERQPERLKKALNIIENMMLQRNRKSSC